MPHVLSYQQTTGVLMPGGPGTDLRGSAPISPSRNSEEELVLAAELADAMSLSAAAAAAPSEPLDVERSF
jgi:hypothetical protein